MSKSNTNHGWRRLFHLPVLVVAVGLPLISSSQALSQEEAETRPNPYGDIAIDSEFGTDIEQLKAAGIIDGTECGDENADFCPDDPIRRRTFAVWLTRALEGDDAPDLVDPDQDSELSIDLSTIDPEVLEDMDPELIAQLTPRFADVPFNTPEHGFIEFFAERGITNGCSLELKKFCPDSHISRKHMAVFFDRAFAFPSVDATGFVDVDANNPSNDIMKRVWSAKIADACTTHGPLYFCPNDKLSRGQMAGLLARAIRWREANEPLKPSGQDNSVNLRVNSYDEETHQADISWSSPSSQNEVSHYVLQWRAPWEAFGADKHEVVATTDENNYNALLSNPTSNNDLYAVRVITVYANGERLASNEAKVPSNTHKLRDLIEEKIIDPHQQRQPWLTDTWRYVNSPRFGIGVSAGRVARVTAGSSPFYPRDSLRSVFARGLGFGSNLLNNFDDGSVEIETMVHELGHVYTMTNGIVTGEGSTALGLGHLRLSLFAKENKDSKGSIIRCLDHRGALCRFGHPSLLW